MSGAEGLQYRPTYEIEKPPEDYRAELKWIFGNDPYTKPLAERLGFRPGFDDEKLLISLANRDPSVTTDISRITGRVATIASDPISILGVPYDTLEFGGFGFLKFVAFEAVGVMDFTQPVQLPSSANFAEVYPTVTQQDVYRGKKLITISDSFHFTGAYTKKQAAEKVATTLFVLNRISYRNPPPFIVPVPIGIGCYPDILDPQGNPAYFIAFKTPYKGERTGNVIIHRDKPDDITKHARDLLESVPKITQILLFMHNSMGITHNQPHPGNYLTPKDSIPYLADFSTVYPLYPEEQQLARARDLSSPPVSIWQRLNGLLLQSTDEQVYAGLVFMEIVKKYLGIKMAIAPTKVNLINTALVGAITAATQKGVLPKSDKYKDSWDKITELKIKLLNQIK